MIKLFIIFHNKSAVLENGSTLTYEAIAGIYTNASAALAEKKRLESDAGPFPGASYSIVSTSTK